MELKTARLTLLIDPNKKIAFERLCAQQDLTPSQVVRQLIRGYLAQHGVQYVGSGWTADDAQAADGPASPQTKDLPDRVVSPPAKQRAGHRRG